MEEPGAALHEPVVAVLECRYLWLSAALLDRRERVM
jgi:hypothetical protein